MRERFAGMDGVCAELDMDDFDKIAVPLAQKYPLPLYSSKCDAANASALCRCVSGDEKLELILLDTIKGSCKRRNWAKGLAPSLSRSIRGGEGSRWECQGCWRT